MSKLSPSLTGRAESPPYGRRPKNSSITEKTVNHAGSSVCPLCGNSLLSVNETVARVSIEDESGAQALMLELRASIGRWMRVHQVYISDVAEAAGVSYHVLYHYLRNEVITRGPAAETYARLRDREMYLPQPWDVRTAQLLDEICRYHKV